MTQPILRFLVLCLVAAALAAPLSACGKRGKPKPPDGSHVTYPKSYPTH